MGPRGTLYRLATTPTDYRACHRLARAGGDTATLGFPTVLAERGRQLLGFLSTHPTKKAVIAGPLVNPGHPIISLRLMEAYETVLRKAGLTFYYFSVHRGDGAARWRETLRKFGLEPYETDAAYCWYMRRL